MKTTFAVLAACTLSTAALAQEPGTPPPLTPPAPHTNALPPTPPTPPVPPAPPTPPMPVHSHSHSHEPAVFLGVEVSSVPSALSDQLNLPPGFGVVVDYVVPGSAAETAGVKPHDILRLLNEQILTGSEQLSALVRSFADGQEVTLTVLRKSQEMKLTAKLQKHPMTSEEHRVRVRNSEGDDDNDMDFGFDWKGAFDPQSVARLKEAIAAKQTEAMEKATEQVERSLESMHIHKGDSDSGPGSAKGPGNRIDTRHALITVRNSDGNLEIRSENGRRKLLVRDKDGKVVFDGPINSPDELKAVPAEVRSEVEKLWREQLIKFPDADDDHASPEASPAH